jgi:hypothetical protein
MLAVMLPVRKQSAGSISVDSGTVLVMISCPHLLAMLDAEYLKGAVVEDDKLQVRKCSWITGPFQHLTVLDSGRLGAYDENDLTDIRVRADSPVNSEVWILRRHDNADTGKLDGWLV